MRDDDLDGGARGPLWRLVGSVISVALVSEYIVLVAATLVLRAVFGLAGGVRRRLSLREVPREATPGAEAA